MRDINELRRGLDAETAHLVVDIPPQLIRRRVRWVRIRRATAIAIGAALTVTAIATPVLLLGGGSDPTPGIAAPVSTSACPDPSASPATAEVTPGAPVEVGGRLGPFVNTGTTFDAPNLNTQFDVLIGLDGTPDEPAFVIAFRDRRTARIEPWDTSVLRRDTQGDLPGKGADGQTRRFLSQQLVLGPHLVLDIGLYTRVAPRLTVTSEDHPTDAQASVNEATGWTLFWAQRDAAPLPPDYNMTSVEYDGPEKVTLTAYDAAGNVEFAVTGGVFVGNNVQNPRDNSPDPSTASTPPAPIPSATGC